MRRNEWIGELRVGAHGNIHTFRREWSIFYYPKKYLGHFLFQGFEYATYRYKAIAMKEAKRLAKAHIICQRDNCDWSGIFNIPKNGMGDFLEGIKCKNCPGCGYPSLH